VKVDLLLFAQLCDLKGLFKMKQFHCNSQPRKGSVMVLASLLMVALLGCAGLAVDYGVLVADKNRLQRAADAGALAGAAWLQRSGDSIVDNRNATEQAVKVALANGLQSNEVGAGDVSIFEDNTKLRLTTRRNRTLFFMRVLGVDSQNLSAQSTATITGRFTPKAVPIGITPQTFSSYNSNTALRTLTLNRLQSTDFIRTEIPQFDPFILSDYREEGSNGSAGSPRKMQDQIAGEEKVPVNIGNAPRILTSNAQAGFFKEGIGVMFARAAGAPWNDGVALGEAWQTVGTQFNNIVAGTAPADNPRVVSLYITDNIASTGGSYNSPVRGFAPVYIESVTTDALGFTKMQVRFFPPTSGFASQSVALVDDIN
jgi:Flp pilus assembly protein TadG